MAKQKTVYFCSQCGHESSKWMGQCPACKQWNTFTEEKVTETKKGGAKSLKTSASPMNISEVKVPYRWSEEIRESGNPRYYYRYAGILRTANVRFCIFLGKNLCIRSR